MATTLSDLPAFATQRAMIYLANGLGQSFMRYFWIALVASWSLAACNATNSDVSFTGPSGQEIHTAKCSQAPTGCYAESSKVCNGSFQVLDSDSHAGGLIADILPGPVTWYGMTYSCGKSDGRLPSFPFKGQQYIPSAGPVITNCQSFGNSVSCQQY